MKKILFSVASALLIISCNDAATDSSNSAAEKAKHNNREILSGIEKGDLSKADSFIVSDAVDHSGANGMMEIKGIENIKKDLATIKQDFSEIKFDILQEAPNGDYLFVMAKITATTSANPGHGMQPNQKIESTSVDVLKFNSDGKFTEHWLFNDPKEMMKMMGGGNTKNTGDSSALTTTPVTTDSVAK